MQWMKTKTKVPEVYEVRQSRGHDHGGEDSMALRELEMTVAVPLPTAESWDHTQMFLSLSLSLKSTDFASLFLS